MSIFNRILGITHHRKVVAEIVEHSNRRTLLISRSTGRDFAEMSDEAAESMLRDGYSMKWYFNKKA